jgi:hypothetical protein
MSFVTVVRSKKNSNKNSNKNTNTNCKKYNNNKAPTPYCSTCHKANLPVEKYTSHWTKSSPDNDGVIVCPFILNSVCGYCRQTGHWTKYCPKIEGRNKNTNTNKKEEEEEVKEVVDESPIIVYRPVTPDYPPPNFVPLNFVPSNFVTEVSQVTNKSTYALAVALSLNLHKKTPDSSPPPPAAPVVPMVYEPIKRRNISHCWADDDYWGD